MKKILYLILFVAPLFSKAQVSHSSFFGGSINYKGYQTGIGYSLQKSHHTIQLSAFKNQSVGRFFADNHWAMGLSYQYAIDPDARLVMGPEIDFQKMWLNKVDNRYSDSRILSLAYFMKWSITEKVSLSNSIGTGGYIERFYLVNEKEPDTFRGIGGLIKLQCAYTF
jgi:hypothetical protein